MHLWNIIRLVIAFLPQDLKLNNSLSMLCRAKPRCPFLGGKHLWFLSKCHIIKYIKTTHLSCQTLQVVMNKASWLCMSLVLTGRVHWGGNPELLMFHSFATSFSGSQMAQEFLSALKLTYKEWLRTDSLNAEIGTLHLLLLCHAARSFGIQRNSKFNIITLYKPGTLWRSFIKVCQNARQEIRILF